ncbi:hypothetical protein [Flavivirga rizhaonensis]|uniref:Uncharacterized protein n=1 Tax=Flavivirga rizhaonensis TaxID=2559571 RepID=A0A4S1E174_9FLAO|nr:hypothetical protein [Flavivirga rizhaonensis]TGV03642.1 hypothetical protein EM932_06350 [Flavivirga rizhaonensis]
MTDISQQILDYLSSLDWAYILTFILIAYSINQYKITDWLSKVLKIKIQTRYRVLLIGLIYGIFLFFIRGYTIEKVERLLQSFVFSMVFHKLILETILNKFFNPNKSI